MTNDNTISKDAPRYIILDQGNMAKPLPALQNGDWNKWAEWVKDGVRSNTRKMETLDDKVDNLEIAIKVQQFKVGVWGCIGASLPAIVTFIILLMAGKI